MSIEKKNKVVPQVNSTLRSDNITVPTAILEASGISVFGRRLKSFLFCTDVATICYTNADAILAVYPQTPHPSIIQAIINVSTRPVFAGVGGGLTGGRRSANIALLAEAEGALGVVVNAPIAIETVKMIDEAIDSPIIQTIVTKYANIDERLEAGADILNIACGKQTPELVRWVRERYPEVPIIATGGKSEASIRAVIDAGANAVSWTAPTNAELFHEKMEKYRKDKRSDFIESHHGMTIDEYEDSLREHD